MRDYIKTKSKVKSAESHIVTAYDRELAALSNLLNQMGSSVVDLVVIAEGLLGGKPAKNTKDFDKALTLYKKVVLLEKEAQMQAIKMLALRNPVASDLLYVASAIKVAGMLERMGELAVKITKKFSKLQQVPHKSVLKNMEKLADQVSKMIHASVKAFDSEDPSKSKKVMQLEDVVDDIFSEVSKQIQGDMMKSPKNIPSYMQAMLIARNFERIGDHATDIAKAARYLQSDEQ